MEIFDNVVHSCIVSFLTTKEYVLTLSLSKTIREKSIRHKKMRLPFIIAYSWNNNLERYHYLHTCHVSKECRQHKDWPKGYWPQDKIHSNPNAIYVILQLGKKSRDANITLKAVPYGFRTATRSRGSMYLNKYIASKLAKYEEKAQDNPSLREFYFDKLIRKRNVFKNYMKTKDVYLDELHDYLNTNLE